MSGGSTGIIPKVSVSLTSMHPADWSTVQAIYTAGMATGQATFETTTPEWDQWDAGHFPVPRLVARDDGEIVGWAALSPVSSRHVYRGVAEVSVYVDPARSGEGIGAVLMAELIIASEDVGVWTLQGSVFRENPASIALHLRHGFREVGERERIARHHGSWRDTVILERRSHRVGTD